MKMPSKRYVHFHGVYKEKYHEEVLEVYADSIFNLFNIIFVEAFPELLNEKHLTIAFEDENGNMTELFDPEQELHDNQKILHIMPNPDGAIFQVVVAIIVAIVSVGVALLMAPKVGVNTSSASGNNWETPENVVGQGGVIPVVLGKRLVGSRVASYGLDTTVYKARGNESFSSGGGGGGGGGGEVPKLQK